jgi:uncharacterized protein YbbC (DUF1343 family)
MVIAMKENMGKTCLPWVGIDALLADQVRLDSLKGKRVGLIANQASLTANMQPSAYVLQNRLGSSLACLFTLEHGWSAFCAAGEKVGDDLEPHTNLPIYSLYGPLFEKNVQRLSSLDCLIIDVQDVGVRCYTYAATCAKVIEHAARNGYVTEFIVCDRPNPLGSTMRGPRWDLAYRSLVSYINVPFQHGKTMGSLLEEHSQTLPNVVPLTVISTSDEFDPKSHLWIPPSPGLPDWHAVLLYPGLVLLEGTNVSEGRGSPLPFKCVAAPKLDAMQLLAILNAIPQSGIVACPFTFTPASGKLSGQDCLGVRLHVIDEQHLDGFALGVYILHALVHTYPLFEWVRLDKHERYWIDAITGSSYLRTAILAGKGPQEILRSPS